MMAIIKHDQYGKRIVRHDPFQRNDVGDDVIRIVAALVGLAIMLGAILTIIFIAGGGM
jgi:hypothetical protein